MRPAASKLRCALSAQRRTFLPPNIAVTGYPVQNLATTGSSGARSFVAWEAVAQPINQEMLSKYGRMGARVNPSKAHDPAIDKADVVTYNSYPESVVGRNDRFGKATEEMLFGYPNTEEKYLKKYLKPRASNDYERRVKFYGLLAVPRAITMFIVKSGVAGLIMHLGPRADMKAMANTEVDIGFLEPGQMTTIMWQGKPVFVHRRTEKQIHDVESTPIGDLRDPQTDAERFSNPEYAIMIAICTHLGCIPVYGAGDYGAYLCPCHGSHYDYSGRIRKGPAPLNLEIPAYCFLDDHTLLIGSSSPA
ncbi:Cytochrome b-c1 complex subunit Rieske-3 [Diplonema papillatum]|nr:Cytochrome b-c1 complex subunit Rieske-3 [Diplonema papillatum]|eukprot:gene11925-18398_t